MFTATQTRRDRFAKPLAMGLAILSLIFFLQIAAHGHNDSWQDGACRVCQMARGNGAGGAAVTFDAPLMVLGEVAAEVVRATTQDSVSQSSPRAPPSLNA